MKKLKIILAICTLSLVLDSCKKGGVFCYQADGDIITQERVHSDFSKISLDMDAELYITQGEDYAVMIEGSNNLMGIIETKVSGNTLQIDIKRGKCIKNNSNVKFFVTLPELKSISISGSGDVFIPNKLTADELRMNISGSGSFEVDSLDANHLESDISGSGDLYITSIDTIQSQTVNISGSGEVHTFNVPTKEVSIRVSGSGECEVNAIETLDVDISGSGDVIYKGNPVIDQRISGSGTIKPF